LRAALIKGIAGFIVISIVAFLAIYKFRALRDGFSKAISAQRRELEEKAAFCEAAAEKLKEVDLLKRGFFTNLISAINEPLKAVAGTLKGAVLSLEGRPQSASDSGGAGDGQLRDRLQFALTETARLSELVEDYQQIEMFRQKLVGSESALVSPAVVVAQTLAEDLALVQRLPQLNISVDVPEGLPQVRADADLLRRAISALVNYAARGAGRGRINVKGRVNPSGWLELSMTGSAYELAGAPTGAVLDESRQFLSRLATGTEPADASSTFISIVLARVIVEYYGGQIEPSPSDTANPGFVVLLPKAA